MIIMLLGDLIHTNTHTHTYIRVNNEPDKANETCLFLNKFFFLYFKSASGIMLFVLQQQKKREKTLRLYICMYVCMCVSVRVFFKH